MKLLLTVSVCLVSCTALLQDFVAVTGNPHGSAKCFTHEEPSTAAGGGAACECPAQALSPQNLALDPVEPQGDTFLTVVKKKWMNFEIPVYHFKQPERLSELQLPFKVVRVKQLDPTGIVELSVPPRMSADSWFVGYSWSIVMCQQCQHPLHLGWRFTSNANPQDFFYALIVSYGDNKENAGGLASKIAGALHIGIKAPEWMTVFAAATIAYNAKV